MLFSAARSVDTKTCTDRPQHPTSRLWKTSQNRVNLSVKRLEKAIDEVVEFSIALTGRFHFPDGVNNRRVVLTAKASPNLRQRRVRQRLTEEHRNLPRQRNRSGAVPRFQVGDPQLVVIGDELLDHVDGHRLVVAFQDVAQNVLRQR